MISRIRGGSRPIGTVRVNLGRFDPTEPPRTTMMKGEAGLQGRFGVVQLHRTSQNHCHEGGSRLAGQFRVSTGWFNHTKPPRTTFLQGKQDYRGVSSEVGVV